MMTPPKGPKQASPSVVFDQTAAKTMGAPQVDTRYQDGTGDAEFTRQITQDEYDTIMSQIYLKESNLDLLKLA